MIKKGIIRWLRSPHLWLPSLMMFFGMLMMSLGAIANWHDSTVASKAGDPFKAKVVRGIAWVEWAMAASFVAGFVMVQIQTRRARRKTLADGNAFYAEQISNVNELIRTAREAEIPAEEMKKLGELRKLIENKHREFLEEYE